MANLRLGQDAGSQQRVDLASYISGYVDGEGCFNVSFSPRPTLLAGWEVKTLKWEIRSLYSILDRVLPHVRHNPLLSSKQKDFELFARSCEAIARREHRT